MSVRGFWKELSDYLTAAAFRTANRGTWHPEIGAVAAQPAE